MQVEMHTNETTGKQETRLFASIQVAFYHIARKDRLDAIEAKLQYFSGLNVRNQYNNHVIYAYFDNELYADNAIEDVKVLTSCSSELIHGRFDVTDLIAR